MFRLVEATTTSKLKVKQLGFPTTYVYKCIEHNHTFLSDKYPTKCPKHGGPIKRVIAKPIIIPTGKIIVGSKTKVKASGQLAGINVRYMLKEFLEGSSIRELVRRKDEFS